MDIFWLWVIVFDCIIFDSRVVEVILVINIGLVGILFNYVLFLIGLDIGILKIRINELWFVVVVMGGFVMVYDNDIIILVNEVENVKEINL